MKYSHRIITIFLLVGFLLACIPVLYALYQARRQAISERYLELEEVSQGLDRRLRNTSDMLDEMHAAVSAGDVAPCSPAGLQQLQRIAARTQISIAALYVENDRVLCSSSDPLMKQLVLNTAAVSPHNGIRLYNHVRLPGVRERSYSVMEKDGYALLFYPEGLIAPFVQPDLSLGLFSPRSGQYGAHSGVMLEHWISAPTSRSAPSRFMDTEAGFLVVRHVMQPSNTGVIVATPLSSIDPRMAVFSSWFIPAGLVVGLCVMLGALWLTRHQLSPRNRLLHALHKNQFFLLYQPIVDLRDGACVGAEALLRWQLEDGTVLSPDSFIPIAEESGVIQQVTAQVLMLVERDMCGFLQRTPHFSLAVNLAASDLKSERTPEMLAAMVQRIGAGCGQFVVEATERGLLEETSALGVLSTIRKLGIQIAIDDFGTGYSSLSYLATYPFDILKVDRSFTSTACTQAVTSQVAVHILELARTLGMQGLAEGIETAEQANFFRCRGVLYGQGYLFGKPMPAAELFELVRDNDRPAPPAAQVHRGKATSEATSATAN